MKSRAWLRPVLVVLTIVVWMGIGGAGGQTFGVLSSVQENENSVFLPSSAESTKAAAAHADFVPSDAVPGLFVVDGAGPEQSAAVQSFIDAAVAAPLEGDEQGRTVGDILASDPQVVPAQDGQATLIVFDVDAKLFGETAGEATLGGLLAQSVRATWADQGVDADGYLTGAVGLVADLVEAFSGIDGILLLVALLVVLVILLIVYRSPVLPFLVLITSMIALSAAIVLVYAMAKADVITLNGQSQGIMFILVVGATTDYALLLVARYREELLHRRSPYDAMREAWRRSIAPISASAGTVVAGLLVLLLSDLKSNASLGPAGAIGIAAAFLASLTLLPALLLIGGKHARGVFWPARPRFLGDDDDDATTVQAIEARSGVWGRVSRAVDARPRRVWIGATVLLVAMAAGLTQLEADGLGDRDVFLTKTESIEGFRVLEDHFAAGATAPVRIIAAQQDADAVVTAVKGVPGVEDAFLLTP
ncbi:MAG: hypothetical protein CVT68_03560, partial [Actinobacteria bacterium HGW-Actinobacteria-8]